MQRIFAFYLPQFHEIEENNTWWGKGFTEWTNVKKAKPVFPEHNQPRVPGELGHYLLDDLEPMRKQTELAKKNGVNGFIFYYYDFDGKRLLEKPLQIWLEGHLELDFAICWANENWTRTWDGAEKQVIMPQNYDIGFEARLIADWLPIFRNERYLRIDSKPVLIIYRIQDLPNPAESIEKFRNAAKREGISDIYIAAVASFGLSSPYESGVDALIEFPPHGVGGVSQVEKPKKTIKKFRGNFFDMRLLAKSLVETEIPEFHFYRGIMPGWDNTPRRNLTSNIFLNSSPALFEKLLRYLRSWTAQASQINGQEEIVFVNAWNEWAEGAYLEPDSKFGNRYLQAVKESETDSEASKIKKNRIELLNFINHRDALSDSTNKNDVSLARIERQKASRLHRIIRLISPSTLLQVWYKLKEDPTGRQLFLAILIVSKDLAKNSTPINVEKKWVVEKAVTEKRNRQIAYVVHIHYPEYVDALFAILEGNPNISKVFVSTSSISIYERLIDEGKSWSDALVIKMVENKGRNFMPLFVSFAPELISSNFDFVVHLHSKRTPQAGKHAGREWGRRLWGQLGLDASLLNRTLCVMENELASLSYADVSDLIATRNMYWGPDLNKGRELAKRLNSQIFSLDSPGQQIDFPAGGMFVVKHGVLKALLNLKLTSEDFPPEGGQTSGEIHHALERFIGQYCLDFQSPITVYSHAEDGFFFVDQHRN